MSYQAFVVLVAAVLAGQAGGAGQPQPARGAILLDVSVEFAAGAAAAGLETADFEVVTEAYKPAVASVTLNRQPLNLALLVDISSSVMRRVDKNDIEKGVKDFFIEVLQPGERALIGGFARDLNLSKELTRDERALRRALDSALSHRRETIYGPSPIWDHTQRTLERLSTVDGRKAVILFTDGRATGNRLSITDVAEYALRHGIVINVIGEDRESYIRQDDTTAVFVRPGNPLRWIAHATGGHYIPAAETLREPGAVIQQLLFELRGAYTIAFAAPVADGALHPVEVRARRPDLTLRAPRLYQSPVASRQSSVSRQR